MISKRTWLTGALLLIFAVVLVRSAWLCDDAYITFRSCENLVTGYGFTFNPGERVQAFTHPLWAILVAGVILASGEVYFSSLILSMLLSLATLFFVTARLSPNLRGAWLGGLVLLLSKGFVDYSTSGLENPLTHLLLVGLWAVAWSGPTNSRRLLSLGLLTSALLLNRLDLALLVAPLCLDRLLAWGGPWKKAVWPLLASILPLLLWELFSFWYYGSIFPNTALAKLNVGIDRSELIVRGLEYLISCAHSDPLTSVVILAGLISAFLHPVRSARVAAIGVWLYLFYVVAIGGDFMAGRFLTGPFLFSLLILLRLPWLDSKQTSWLALPILLLHLLTPHPSVWSGAGYGQDRGADLKARDIGTHAGQTWSNLSVFADRFGVADERAFYYPFTGLLRAFSQEEFPSLVWAAWGRQLRNEGRAVITYGNVGMVGYFSGPNVYLVDPAGLTDAFLARLPPRAVPNWRTGHWVREIPAGYLESRSQGGNRLAEPMLARLYDQVQTLTEGDLFSWARLRLAWWFLGGTPIEIDRQALRYPVSKQVLYEELMKLGEHELVFEKPGLGVVLPGAQRARKIEISVENNDIYWLVFFRDRQMVHGVVLPPEVRLAPGAILSWPKESKAGLRRFILSMPADVDSKGFDELRIMVLAGDLEHRVGTLRLVP